MRSAIRALCVLLIATYTVVGAIWFLRHLGEVPHYGDTTNYLIFARQMAVNEHRGILYPMLLATLGRGCLAEEGPTNEGLRAEEKEADVTVCAYPDCWTVIQLVQAAACSVALWYFLAVVTRPDGGARPGVSKVTITLLALIVALDPLIAHFNLSLMTDALATTGALVFCAAFSAFLAPRPGAKTRGLGHGFLILLGVFLTCGMRVEKWQVVVVTTAAATVTWIFAMRRDGGLRSAGAGRRLAAAAMLVLVAVALARGLQKKYETVADDWWSLAESTVHFRVVYPNLSRVYDQLPAYTRARLSREDAVLYDRDINSVRRVVNRIAERDEKMRRRLTDEMARTVVRQLWPSLVADVGHDFLDNGLATYSTWARLALQRIWKIKAVRNIEGANAVRPWIFSGSAYWNFTRMTSHHKWWAFAHIYLSLLIIGVASLISVVRALCWVRSRKPAFSWSAFLPWSPALWFWFFNAAAFALAVNNSNYRYMIFSHVMILVLILLRFDCRVPCAFGTASRAPSALARRRHGRLPKISSKPKPRPKLGWRGSPGS